LATAHTLLQKQAAKIPEEFHRSFLENIPWHREIVALWEARRADQKPKGNDDES
jgi:hypothetical protein